MFSDVVHIVPRQLQTNCDSSVIGPAILELFGLLLVKSFDLSTKQPEEIGSYLLKILETKVSLTAEEFERLTAEIIAKIKY